MSDEPILPPTEPERQHTGPFVHHCEHPGCKAWGGFGFSRGKSAVLWSKLTIYEVYTSYIMMLITGHDERCEI